MKIPKFEVIGHGPRKWRISIDVLPLSAFQTAFRDTFRESGAGPLPYAFWRDTDRKIFIRADLRLPQQWNKLKHELRHVFVDWLDWVYPDPGD